MGLPCTAVCGSQHGSPSQRFSCTLLWLPFGPIAVCVCGPRSPLARERFARACFGALLGTPPLSAASRRCPAPLPGVRAPPASPAALRQQEVERYNLLLLQVRRSCVDLSAGIRGTVVMSADLDAVAAALAAGRVPPAWLRAYPSLKPLGAWVRDLLARVEQLARWAAGTYPKVYWLSGFTYPTGFLTAVLQVGWQVGQGSKGDRRALVGH
jgi:hypothetical protein